MHSPSKKRLLDWSRGKQEIFHYDQHEGKFTIETKEDCEPLIKISKDMSELQPSKDFRHAANIPQFVLDKSYRERWDRKDWKKWANSSRAKPFRTWPGTL
jgi:hypothetical protein